MKAASIAAACHAVNVAYCASLGDTSQPAWADAPDWHKASVIAGVEMHLANPDARPEQSHESWLARKLADGWKFGPVKDADKKEHPCCLPYAELPTEQKAKDYIFRSVVHALKGLPDEAMPAPTPEPVIPNTSNFQPVKYIGKRETYRDGTYGTGLEFVRGGTRLVPAEIAQLMFRHPDVYVPGDPQTVFAAPSAPTKKTDESDDPTQQARDSVAHMTKDALAVYAKTHFRVDLDQKKRVGDLREEVVRMIDQYGLT